MELIEAVNTLTWPGAIVIVGMLLVVAVLINGMFK
jgi:hypothetical protein